MEGTVVINKTLKKMKMSVVGGETKQKFHLTFQHLSRVMAKQVVRLSLF